MTNIGVLLAGIGAFALGVAGQAGNGADAILQNPYTARFKVTKMQTLTDGTTITHESTEAEIRDSHGRRLRIVTNLDTYGRPEHSAYFEFDKQNGTNAIWSEPGSEIFLTPAPPAATKPGECFSTGTNDTTSRVATALLSNKSSLPVKDQTPTKPLETNEDLGTESFLGVDATGVRTVATIPAGREGNNAPFVITMEIWRAKALSNLDVRSVIDDPQSGKTVRELTELDRNEPDPSVFEPPASYHIRNVEWRSVPCSQ